MQRNETDRNSQKKLQAIKFTDSNRFISPCLLAALTHDQEIDEVYNPHKLLTDETLYEGLSSEGKYVWRLAESAYEFVRRVAVYGSSNKKADLENTHFFVDKLLVEERDRPGNFKSNIDIMVMPQLPIVGFEPIKTIIITPDGLFKLRVTDSQLVYNCLLSADKLKKIDPFFENLDTRFSTSLKNILTTQQLEKINEAVIACNDSESIYFNIEEITTDTLKKSARDILLSRSGNCQEKMALAFLYLYSHDRNNFVKTLAIIKPDSISDHVLLGINLSDENLTTKENISAEALILDVWAEEMYLASDFLQHGKEIEEFCNINKCSNFNYLRIKYPDVHLLETKLLEDSKEQIKEFINYYSSYAFPQPLLFQNNTQRNALLENIKQTADKPIKSNSCKLFANNKERNRSLICETELIYDFYVSKVVPEFYSQYLINGDSSELPDSMTLLASLPCYEKIPGITHQIDLERLMQRFKILSDDEYFSRYFEYKKLFKISNSLAGIDCYQMMNSLLEKLVAVAHEKAATCSNSSAHLKP